MNGRNGFTEHDAGRPLQRLSDGDMATILRRLSTDLMSEANQLGSLARMLERSHGAGRRVGPDQAARLAGEGDDGR